MDQPGTILPVILRPGEVSLDAASAYVDAVTGACSAVGFWFHQQMGRAFRSFDPQPLAVEALDDEAYWRDPLDSLAQTMEARGWPNRSGGGFVPFIYIGFLPGHGGWAGTVHRDDQAGLIGLGDACLRGISGDTAGCLDIIGGSRRRCSMDGQRGALAHELRHALGRGGHESPRPGSREAWLSDTGYELFPDCALSAEDRAMMLEPPWEVFFAAPDSGPAATAGPSRRPPESRGLYRVLRRGLGVWPAGSRAVG